VSTQHLEFHRLPRPLQHLESPPLAAALQIDSSQRHHRVLAGQVKPRDGADKIAHSKQILNPCASLDQDALSTVDVGEDAPIGDADLRDYVEEEDPVWEVVDVPGRLGKDSPA